MDCWHDEIESARTEAEVTRRANEYLSLWAPPGLSPQALGLSAMHIETSDELERVSLALARMPIDVPYGARLREIADYFWHAASRVVELRR